MNHDYNTQRKRMALPEYGRNVQKMVDHIKSIGDMDERNRAARTIIQIMANLNPNLRDTGDVKHKLWDHLAIIADFELEIDSPFPPPQKEVLAEKPARVAYQEGEVRFLHYGRIIEMLVEEAAKMEDGKEKDYLINLIANQMKKAASAWNRGNVSDDVIMKDLVELSNKRITIPENMKLLEIRELLGPKKKKPVQKQSKQPRKKFQGRH
ncbi:MAG: DUF4290 domain-containing protein [Bacteroidia bacterium]|nr:MAG: DUF4290 domain-containing protein [Bacteroidia bacterium]